MPISEMIKGGVAVAAMAAILCLPSNTVLAGIENQETGEQCWGQDCSDMDGVSEPSSGSTDSYVTLPNVRIYDCNALEIEKIDRSVRWLKDNMALVDAQMGRNSLMDWPGRSRKKFVNKLDKELKFYCINQKKKCGDLLGIVYPVFEQKQIHLCTQSIRDTADGLGINRQSIYASVVAHEIGHLVRLNDHRNRCYDNINRPRFSQALGSAVEAAHRGIDYDPAVWQAARCPTATASSGAGGMDVIDNKLQPPPIE